LAKENEPDWKRSRGFELAHIAGARSIEEDYERNVFALSPKLLCHLIDNHAGSTPSAQEIGTCGSHFAEGIDEIRRDVLHRDRAGEGRRFRQEKAEYRLFGIQAPDEGSPDVGLAGLKDQWRPGAMGLDREDLLSQRPEPFGSQVFRESLNRRGVQERGQRDSPPERPFDLGEELGRE
jgi:hypothetical protein